MLRKLSRKLANMPQKEIQENLNNTKELLDSISKYFESLSSINVKPTKSPVPLPKDLPIIPIPFNQILNTIETSIYPNNLHWLHPMFFGYFPASTSWPSIQGSLVSKALSSVAFTTSSCPISTEIEKLVSNWLGQMLNLPNQFIYGKGEGGGLTYGSASEAVLTAMACARLKKNTVNPVAYTSNQSHFSIIKAAKVLGIPIRLIPGDRDNNGNYPLDPKKLVKQIEDDKEKGFTPIFICGCVGTTNVGAIDDLETIGKIAEKEDSWFHIDAAYAGSFAILPELRHILNGVELATTFNMNSSKMLLCGFDCSNMWIKDSSLLTNHLTQNADYMKKSNVIDYKDWQIPLGRNVKGLPLWMVIQQFGVEGIQKYLRNHIEAGKLMEKLVDEDKRLEIIARRSFGLVGFRVKGENELTDGVIQRLAENQEIFLLGSKSDGRSFIRFSPGSNPPDLSNVRKAFEIVKGYLDELTN
ncbi:hypothetical protein SteCoe_8263 [Stentor coeruleus]|uniref:Tyrosine decarboxylase n=1 Tax=Stentor coeruleus TaxID=5963 RepID=A0A1R2CKP6_9CILI|nr:hypothetical protein SteCoe_8263 [Stentor coeruleus]